MDGIAFGLTGGSQWTVLQRLLVQCPPERRALYWRDVRSDAAGMRSIDCPESGALTIAPDAVLGLDTYFNAFFEAQWHRHTVLDGVALRIALSAPCLVRIYRHALHHKRLVAEQHVGPGTAIIPVPSPGNNFRQYGFLSVEICTGEVASTLLDSAWITQDRPASQVGLAAIVCTFNREDAIAAVLSAVGSDHAVRDQLARVIVVNQGSADLRRHPAFADAASGLGRRMSLIEQANFGGAGGFSRGLLAALDDPTITHVVLLDDDIELEPDSLLRIAAFFSFCERDIVLGGHMLDMLYPTTLYEAGAVISDRHWSFLPQHFGRQIAKASELESLSHPYAVHYNGWWCCGIPLSLLREHGMPLPCFIRGDDTEFGLRLHQRGVATVPMPGVAVWHEPFYLRLGGWQLYYETRNTLVTASLHQMYDRTGVVRRMGRQIVTHLLTYRYYSTALILEGIRDFLAGPATMEAPPLPRHTALSTLRDRYSPLSMAREQVSYEQRPTPMPRGRMRCLLTLARLLVRNAVLPTSQAAPGIIEIGDVHWLTVRNTGHIAAETWWDDRLPVFRRTREQHRSLLREAAGLMIRLFREGPKAAAAWRAAMPHLTSVAFWNAYLDVPTELAPEAIAQPTPTVVSQTS